MGGAACAAKILLCGPPVANRVANTMAKAVAVAQIALEHGYVESGNLEKLQAAVCRCEALAEKIEAECADALQACMNDVAVCPVPAKE